jgi:hypothetical protein
VKQLAEIALSAFKARADEIAMWAIMAGISEYEERS